MSGDARDEVVEFIEKNYGKLIRHIAYEIVGDYHLAQDVEQEVLWRFVSKHADKFGLPPEEMKNYLCAAVKNAALNLVVKNRKISEVEGAELDHRILIMDEVDIKAFQNEYGYGLEVQELLSKLDNLDKDILCLKYGAGYDVHEISCIVGLGEEAVRKRIYRTKVRMQSILIEEGTM